MKICPVNENSIIIYFSDTITPETADDIGRVLPAIRSELGDYIVDIIPSYTTILVSFNLMAIGLKDFDQKLRSVIENIDRKESGEQKTPCIELPVYYGPEVALDAEEVSNHSGLDFDKVVTIHSSMVYRVYAIGFAPGFAYLGNIDERIAIPRKTTPRLKIPARSVAIADQQTAIYPRESPGGWQVIGRCPVDPIDYRRKNLTLFEVGARVIFKPVSKARFLDMGGVISPDEEPLSFQGAV